MLKTKLSEGFSELVEKYKEAEELSKSFETKRSSKAKDAAHKAAVEARGELKEFIDVNFKSWEKAETMAVFKEILEIQDSTRGDTYWTGTLTGYDHILRAKLASGTLKVEDVASLVSNRLIGKSIADAMNDKPTIFAIADIPKLYEIAKNDLNYITFWRDFIGEGSKKPMNFEPTNLDIVILESLKKFILPSKPYFAPGNDDYWRFVKAYKMLKSDKSKKDFIKFFEGFKDGYLTKAELEHKTRPFYQEHTTKAVNDLLVYLADEN